jgi:hypothetical protein
LVLCASAFLRWLFPVTEPVHQICCACSWPARHDAIIFVAAWGLIWMVMLLVFCACVLP